MLSVVDAAMLIPAPSAQSVELCYASLLERDRFDPTTWARATLQPASQTGWWEIDLAGLGLPDGDYEYEFVVDGRTDTPVADPFADEIVRFGGYRGLFRLRGGMRWRPPFRWDDELTA